MAQVAYLENEGIKIARGMVKDTSHIHRTGSRAVGALGSSGTDELIWQSSANTDIYWPTTAYVANVSSSSASDTAVTLTVKGLDSNWNSISETVRLNGTSTVSTTNTFIRVESVINTSNTATIGAVAVKQNGSYVTNFLPAAQPRGLRAVYSVPAANTAYLTKFDATIAGTSSGNITVLVYAKDNTLNNGTGGQWVIYHVCRIASGSHDYEFPVPLKFTEKTDIKFVVNCATASVGIACNYDIILVQN